MRRATLDREENGVTGRDWHSQMAELEPMEALFQPNTTSLPACSVM